MRAASDDPITIRSDAASAEIVLQGGCLASYRLERRGQRFDLLRPLAPDRPFDPLEAACYPLVPYSGRIRDGRFRFAGGEYRLPLNFGTHPNSIHGVAWQARWTCIAAEAQEAVLALEYGGGDWPWPFAARQEVRLDGADLSVALSLRNTGTAPMPAGLGLHPFFPRHDGAVLTAAVDDVWFNDMTCLPLARLPCPPEYDLRQGREVAGLRCDNLFERWQGPARIDWPDSHMALELTAADELDRLVVFAPYGADFFCVEPVSHIVDAFNRTAGGMAPQDSGMRVLAPGEQWRVWMRLRPMAA